MPEPSDTANQVAGKIAERLSEKLDRYIDYARVKRAMQRPGDPCGPIKGITQGLIENLIADQVKPIIDSALDAARNEGRSEGMVQAARIARTYDDLIIEREILLSVPDPNLLNRIRSEVKAEDAGILKNKGETFRANASPMDQAAHSYASLLDEQAAAILASSSDPNFKAKVEDEALERFAVKLDQMAHGYFYMTVDADQVPLATATGDALELAARECRAFKSFGR